MRTKQFALATIKFIESLPKRRVINTITNQLLRSATSVGANYRAACRAKSKADFIAKLGIVIEEADECLYWLDLLSESQSIGNEQLAYLTKEANEILSIMIASVKTAKKLH